MLAAGLPIEATPARTYEKHYKRLGTPTIATLATKQHLNSVF